MWGDLSLPPPPAPSVGTAYCFASRAAGNGVLIQTTCQAAHFTAGHSPRHLSQIFVRRGVAHAREHRSPGGARRKTVASGQTGCGTGEQRPGLCGHGKAAPRQVRQQEMVADVTAKTSWCARHPRHAPIPVMTPCRGGPVAVCWAHGVHNDRKGWPLCLLPPLHLESRVQSGAAAVTHVADVISLPIDDAPILNSFDIGTLWHSLARFVGPLISIPHPATTTTTCHVFHPDLVRSRIFRHRNAASGEFQNSV